jgi:hypothetical protein
MKKKPHVIKTAAVVDFMGHGFGAVTPEEEIEQHKERFEEFAAPAKLKVHTPAGVHGIEVGTDLVIYDFGGLMPGNDLMESNARALVQWAVDNPNALVVIVSETTYRNYFKYEAEEMGLMDSLHNVVCDAIPFDEDKKDTHYRTRCSPFPEWFETAHGISSKEN